MNNLYLITELQKEHWLVGWEAFHRQPQKTQYRGNANTLAYSQRSKADSNNERGRETQVEARASSQLPNNNKKHLCVMDQTVRGRWRARQGQIDRNPLWSPPSFTKSVWGITVDTEGRQMAQREHSTWKKNRMGQKERKRHDRRN